MSKKALEDHSFELIKSHCLNPESSPLNQEHHDILDRWISAAKIMDLYPTPRHAASLQMIKHPEIRRSQAYNDLKNGKRLFNSIQTFNFEWWQQWISNDINRLIKACKEVDDRENLIITHSNLIRLLGEKPGIPLDTKLTEKLTFLIPIMVKNKIVNISVEDWHSIPQQIRKKIDISNSESMSID